MNTFDVGDLRPRAVEFAATDLIVTLADGRKIAAPLDWYSRLMRALPQERANFELMPMGVHWPDLDEDLGIAGMLKGEHAWPDWPLFPLQPSLRRGALYP
jgi:hypothetical protein